METQIVHYAGIPPTPPPRRNKVDYNLYTIERKMELALHLLIHSLEKDHKPTLATAAGYIRSALQDTHEQRRAYLAGREAWKLEKRHDDNKPRS